MNTNSEKIEPLVCPKHPDTKLSNIVKPGAGFCRRCFLFVAAAGFEHLVTVAPERKAKRKAKTAKAVKKKASAKSKAARNRHSAITTT